MTTENLMQQRVVCVCGGSLIWRVSGGGDGLSFVWLRRRRLGNSGGGNGLYLSGFLGLIVEAR
jgi:hypothetical protein